MRVAVDWSTFTMADASAVDTGLTGGSEARVKALSEAVVSGAGAGRLVLTGSDPPFLTQSHQIASRRLYPGSAVANAGTRPTDGDQKPRVRRQPRSGPLMALAVTSGTSAR